MTDIHIERYVPSEEVIGLFWDFLSELETEIAFRTKSPQAVSATASVDIADALVRQAREILKKELRAPEKKSNGNS